MGIRVRAVGQSNGMQAGELAGIYDRSCKHPDPNLRGGQLRRIRVGEIFEINDMTEFSDSKKQRADGKHGWMELVDPAPVAAAPAVTEAPKQSVPGQVPGQGIVPVPAELAANSAGGELVGAKKVI